MADIKKRKEPLTNEQVQQKLAEWLRPMVTTTRNGHCCLSEPGARSFIDISGVHYSPVQAAYFITRGVPLDRKVYKYRQSPLCQEKGCLQHRFLYRSGVKRIEDATPDEKQYAREALMKYVKADGECLLWTAELDEDGYGKCTNRFGYIRAHRLAWAVFNGRSVPAGELVRHRCPLDRHHCVAPRHLDVGTPKQNTEDMRRDGTLKIGEQHPSAKLSDAQVQQLKASRGQGSQAQRAAEFRVSHTTVGQIDRCETRKDLWTQKDREEAAARRKRCRPRLAADLIQRIMDSKDDGTTQLARARRFEVSISMVSLIDRGKRDTKTPEERKAVDKLRYYEKMRLHIRASCKLQPSPDGQSHCWIYQGRKNKKGYGKQGFYRRNPGAHMVSWLVHSKEQYERVPQGTDGKRIVVRHRCDVPPCCNPAHLELGTPKQNANDRRRAGTMCEGAAHYCAKLTDEQAQEIRIRASSEPQNVLAKCFRVSCRIINRIVKGQSYKNVL